MAEFGLIQNKIKTAEKFTARASRQPNPKKKVILLGFQAVLDGSIAYERWCDPIPCQFDKDYSYLIHPTVPPCFPPATRESLEAALGATVSPARLALFSACYMGQAELVSFEHCILRTLFRRYTALTLGDKAAFRFQTEHVERLNAGIRATRLRTNKGWKRWVAGFSARERAKLSVVTPADILKTRTVIYKKGFPEEEILVMKALGLSDYDIHNLALLIQFGPPPEKESTFVDDVEDVIAINELDKSFTCTCATPIHLAH